MKIKIERSGGFGGIVTTHEMDADDLPQDLKSTVEGLIENKNTFPPTFNVTPKGAADQYEYKVTIQDGADHREIKCNEYSIRDNLRSLIKYLERNSKKEK